MRCLVVGAGTTGTFLAFALASRGVPVVLAERRSLSNAGARWVNGVQADLLGSLQLPPPPDGLVFHAAERFVMSAADSAHRVTVEEPPLVEMDMRALGAWLLELAEGVGVEVRPRARVVLGPAEDGERLVTVNGRAERFAVVLDARGYHEGLLEEIPEADRLPFTPALDVCAAFQGVYDVRDPEAARIWLGEHGISPGDTWSRAGVEGGYSVLNVCLSEAGDALAVLTGSMQRQGYRPGGTIAGDFVRSMAFVGRRRFGGGRLIPLAPPSASLVEDSLVRVGDAAGQVFPLHGSGIAQGMRAADLAANAVAAALQLGDTSAHGLWSYNVQWQRGEGATNAFHQPLRLLTSSFTREETCAVLEHGLLGSSTLRAGLAQQLPPVDAGALVGATLGLGEVWPILPRVAAAGMLARTMQAHWRAFPRRGPRGEYTSWVRRARALVERAQALALSGTGDGSLPR